MPHALKFAEQHCKAHMSELMRLHETHKPWESPLLVYSIHFDLDEPDPSYAIFKNPDIDWERTPINDGELSKEHSVCMQQYESGDDFWIHVKRVGCQQFELCN